MEEISPKPSSPSSCSFIFSFLFTAEVPERAACSHRRSTQHSGDVRTSPTAVGALCCRLSSPLILCSPRAGHSMSSCVASGASALPVCRAAPSLHRHPAPFLPTFGQALHPDISHSGLSSLCPQLCSTFLQLFPSLREHHGLISSSNSPHLLPLPTSPGCSL